MKAKVIIQFNDKYTGEEHKKGDVIEVTAARFNEIRRQGKYVEAVDETTKENKENK